MTILRANTKQGKRFTQVSNEDVAKNSNLTFQERGFLLYLLSFKDDWQFNRHKILNDNPTIGIQALGRLIRRLVHKGHLRFKQERLGGRFGPSMFFIHEKSIYGEPLYYDQLTEHGLTKKDIYNNTNINNTKEITIPNKETPISPNRDIPGEKKKDRNPRPLKEAPGRDKEPNPLRTHRVRVKNAVPKELRGIYDEVLAHLNHKVNGSYGTKGGEYKDLVTRLREGATLEECKEVIDKKTMEWLGEEKTRVWLNPETLFRVSNFSKYLEAPVRRGLSITTDAQVVEARKTESEEEKRFRTRTLALMQLQGQNKKTNTS